MSNNNIKHLNDENFTETVGHGVTLVDFKAEWCGPCRMMAPVILEFAKEMKGKVTVGELDIDANQKTTQSFQVTSIPTLIIFKDGQEIKRIVGLKDLATLMQLVAPFLT